MPSVYKSGETIRALRGRVRGGITVVVDSPTEIAGLQALIEAASRLPGDPLANAYQAIDSAGDGLADWPDWHGSTKTEGLADTVFERHDPASELMVALDVA